MGKIHQNIQKQVGKTQFKNAFLMDYPKIQGGIQKQMNVVDKSEATINKDLKKTEKGIAKLKKSPPGGVFGMLFGGLKSFLFTAIGGLILITLARMAISKWASTYMPPKDGSQMSIFGIQIPGWDTIKAIGIGIWNFVTIGLPNYWDRLKNFMGNTKRQLFGRKGIFKNAATTKYNLIKILGAIVIANAKKAVGGILKLIGWALFWIPGAKPLCDFLAVIVPTILTFITTQLLVIWGNAKADAATRKKAAEDNASQMTRDKSNQIKTMLLDASSGIKPFRGQLVMMSGFLQTSKKNKGMGLPGRTAIMRSVPVHTNKKFGAGQDQQNENRKKEQESFGDNLKERWNAKDTSNDKFVGWRNNEDEARRLSEQIKGFSGLHDSLKPQNAIDIAQRVDAMRLKTMLNVHEQVKVLDRYIAQLNASKRFQNVRGLLYDPNTGWNAGYRVYANDLRSIIPLKPLEALHSRPDVYFGEPA